MVHLTPEPMAMLPEGLCPFFVVVQKMPYAFSHSLTTVKLKMGLLFYLCLLCRAERHCSQAAWVRKEGR